jgi:methylenetetrahydrofolate dehydrogenase (NADP+)/methenyltetrahydrofolate cyclohydrolase/formyltetrahydrofolate synthetase
MLFLLRSSDTEAELALIRKEALAAGADAAVISSHWEEGGAGARALAEAVVQICEGPSTFKFLYDVTLPIEEKISIISREIYGADGIILSELARKQVDIYTKQGYNDLPSKLAGRPSERCDASHDFICLVCMAKTQYSFSHDPKLKNAPTGST